MKTINTLAAATLLLSTVLAGTAAASISTGSLGNDVQSAVGSGHVSVTVDNGVATLFGGVENRVDANAAEMAAANFPGIDRVINNLNVSN